MANSPHVLITNDVETTSLKNHRLDDRIGELVLSQGMPRLLDLYSKYDVKGTFFFTGHIARLYPEIVRMAYSRGHEVGSHGLSHRVEHAFDVLSPSKQVQHLTESKLILENIIGERIVSFRAPAARVNEHMVNSLLECGFEIDSSVSSQRLDMFMSFGGMKKLKWVTAPRLPYFASRDSIFKKGDSQLFEIPISAFGLPYIGTFMRIAPGASRLTRRLLMIENKFNSKPIVFLTHPNEFLDEERTIENIERRGSSYLSYLLGDLLRYHLKTKNLGKAAIPLLEYDLIAFQTKGANFVTCRAFRDDSLKVK